MRQIRKLFPVLLIALSLVLHLAWALYTNYTEEDAFITYRIAKQITEGNGFVYNIGEPLYASTTPLLTLLLSIWLAFISPNVIFAARLFDFISVTLTLYFIWLALQHLKLSLAEQTGALMMGMMSARLIFMNILGMEIPLGLAALAASWYFWMKGRTNLAGVFCGLLLWIRIDFIFWVLILTAFAAFTNWKNAMRLALIAAAIYLPWLAFATIYFGSPIPFTVTAKWVAYNEFDTSSYWNQLRAILEYLAPFRTGNGPALWGAFISGCLVAAGLWMSRPDVRRSLFLPLAFVFFEIARLTLTRTTYFSRYFIPILWFTTLLSGIGLGALWNAVKNSRLYKVLFLVFVVAMVMIQFQTGLSFAQSIRERQAYRHEDSLKEIGLWLKNNTDLNSTILLEPLGYVGYYSGRTMLDEVGLVTPAVVELKRQRVGAEHYAKLFKPDYVIVHCDDTIRIPRATPQGPNYELAARFNPLDFNGTVSPSDTLPWRACYEIWAKK